jgi:hypothetical protein
MVCANRDVLSSTGDPELDALLPFDEPYCIPPSTASAIRDAQAQPDPTAPCGQAREWLRSASGAAAACAWWMQWVAVLDSLDALAASRYERDVRSSGKQFPDKRQSQAGCAAGNSHSQASKSVSMIG